jgi:hypothetical protein
LCWQTVEQQFNPALAIASTVSYKLRKNLGMRKLALISLILFVSYLSSGQSFRPTKRELIKAFKKSIEQNERNVFHSDSNPWIIDNKDSSYFKSDTLKFVNFNHEFLRQRVCQPLNWTFYKKDRFVLSSGNLCDEPTFMHVSRAEDWYKIKITETKSDLILEIYNSDKQADRFSVVSLKENVDLTLNLTLIRLK